MNDKADIKNIAIQTITAEGNAVLNLTKYIDDDFEKAVNLILHSNGRVIMTGIGKSAIIAQKIVATLNSTGTPAIFMHAADAIHGDLGIILEDDIVICLSKSGNTPEIKVLIPYLKNFGNPIIAMVSNLNSYLAEQADLVLKAVIDKEAGLNDLVPTTSTTSQLVLGDALAVALLECRGFTTDDFAKVHPGGTLGKKLYLRISDLYTHNEVPKVLPDDKIQKIIFEISSKRMGATAVVDESGKLCGIITDGDLRRMLQKNEPLENIKAESIMSKNPKTVEPDMLAINAFDLMKKNSISNLIVTENNTYLGFVHLHDILREGIV